MFTHADVLEQPDGSLVLAVPESLPEGRPLTIGLSPRGFVVASGDQVVGRVDRVTRDVIDALRAAGTVRVLACPSDMDLTRARLTTATVRLLRRPPAA